MSAIELLLERCLPADVDAERAILGSILLDNSAFDHLEGMSEESFSLDSNRRILRTMKAMLRDGEMVDLLTLADRLRERREIESIGGVAYLAWLTEGLPQRLNIGGHVAIVRKKWLLRQIIQTCSGCAARAAEQGADDPEELIAQADQELLALAADTRQEWPSIEKQTHAELERMKAQQSGAAVLCFDYGIPALDKLVGGLAPREVTVLGGRPGQGKSSLIAQIVVRHCRRGVPVHVFSLEMSAGQLLRRIWSIVSGVAFHRVRHPERQTRDEVGRVIAAALEVSNWPLKIDEAAGLTVEQLIARSRIAKRKDGARIVAIDYLQKLRFSEKPQYRYMEVSDCAVRVARLAKEEELAILLLSSVSEKNGRDRNDAPTLQDFRQSGDIAFEASTALLIHREVDPQSEKLRADGLLIVAKARSDDTGAVAVRFNSDFLLFADAGVVQ